MKSLKWQQVNAWRLAQHCLSPRLPPQDFVEAVRRTGGIQAQVTSAAEQAIWARAEGVSPQDVQAALWQEHSLIKTWAMRATLHLIPAADFPLYIAARSLDEPRNWVGYFAYYGIDEAQLEMYLAASPDILEDGPLSREQFADAVAEQTGVPGLRDLIVTKGWGSPLKPLAWRGNLCFGPADGRNVTFVNPRKWIGEWQPVEPEAALQEMARRYLRAYGPATVEEFAGWWGLRLTPARKLFRSLAAELEAVDVEGQRRLSLRAILEPMQDCALSGTVNLLPLFDAYVMGIGRGADIEPILKKEYQRLVYRPQGWMTAVVLVDGVIQGIWEYAQQRSQTLLKIHMFSTCSTAVRNGVEAEADRLGKFLKTKVVPVF